MAILGEEAKGSLGPYLYPLRVGFRVLGFGFWVLGLGFRVHRFQLRGP